MILGIVYPTIIMGVLGLLFGALLAFASIKFFVKIDERVSLIREILPGANCGGCGYPGCDGYADAVVSEGANTGRCAAGGPNLAEKIAAIMGVASEAFVPMRAFLRCQGTARVSARTVGYDGVRDCRSASIIPGGSPNACPYGCIGFGACVTVCNFGALSIVDGLVRVNAAKCVGCGACVDICPKSVLGLTSRSSAVQVFCNSSWKGPDVKKVCSVGCLACGLCVRSCPAKAITLQNNRALIDTKLCTNCGTCVTKCPAKTIGPLNVRRVVEETADSECA
ncbi:MAG: RnfABCDGE type electron transport complex subunit B [Synergistaceae bacterium]|jgi:Na+-translocating ferredoxin:NAD+ oxidoreductase RNF subunit RnfB|nr:RnfABCDGE type electron transport complex subunit B [Synergistaceae bacterium]